MDWQLSGTKATDFIKKYKYAVLIVAVGIFLMMIPEEKAVQEENQEVVEQIHHDLQDSLEEILSKIDGAGKVNVLLTESSGPETIYQLDEDKTVASDTSDIRMETVIISDSSRDETGLICRILPPVYRGAIVVCQGADHAAVRLAIVEAVSKATGLSSNQISVFKMK